jgi:DNA-directed RNA polymerase specialized sigma24 family protein
MPTIAAPPDAEALFAQWLPFIRSLGRRWERYARIDADDIAGEIALTAVRRLATWDPERGAFSTWLGQIARSVASRCHARSVRRPAPIGTVDADGLNRAANVVDHRQLDPAEAAALLELRDAIDAVMTTSGTASATPAPAVR